MESEVSTRAESTDRETTAKSFHATFELLGKVGCGTFAQVFVAKPSRQEGDLLAVKVSMLKPADWDLDRDEGKPSAYTKVSARAIQREVELLRMLSGRAHCLTFHGLYLEGTVAYLVSELCDMSMLELLQSFMPLDAQALRSVFRQMLRGMSSIHSAGIIHRDIKPDNFLCNVAPGGAGTGPRPEFVLKLCDFGLAETVSDRKPMLKGCFGTAPFMSPEMLKREDYDERTDMWSAGVLMHVLLFGYFPYQPKELSPKGMKDAIRSGDQTVTYKCTVHGENGRCSAATLSSAPLLRQMLASSADSRILAREASNHEWFFKEGPRDKDFSYATTLALAKRSGAFDVRNMASMRGKPSAGGMDELILDGQGLYYPSTCTRACEPYAKQRDPSSSPSRRLSSKDPMQADFSSASTRTPCSSANGGSSPKRRNGSPRTRRSHLF
mmetsp:Transcript_43128/g.138694  ORF Transcript_43128/g.138694 Transcript_43128/m.138694 type:complete len:439 (+) Transcript_43128:331-1647(+)